MLISRDRPEGHRLVKAGLPRDVRPRHVLGLLSRPRGHVLRKISPEASRLSGSRSKLSDGYRGLDAGYKLAEEGTYQFLTPHIEKLLMLVVGSIINIHHNNVTPDYHPPTSNQPFSGSLDPIGPPPAAQSLKSWCAKEDNCNSVQIGFSVPRDT